MIRPALDHVKLWPFDGDLSVLLGTPGTTIAEIYPTEAYGHLGVVLGTAAAKKGESGHRRTATKKLLTEYQNDAVQFSDGARAGMQEGFDSDDDFDAMMGVLSMLKVVAGEIPAESPVSPEIRQIEGWILGQRVPTTNVP